MMVVVVGLVGVMIGLVVVVADDPIADKLLNCSSVFCGSLCMYS